MPSPQHSSRFDLQTALLLQSNSVCDLIGEALDRGDINKYEIVEGIKHCLSNASQQAVHAEGVRVLTNLIADKELADDIAIIFCDHIARNPQTAMLRFLVKHACTVPSGVRKLTALFERQQQEMKAEALLDCILTLKAPPIPLIIRVLGAPSFFVRSDHQEFNRLFQILHTQGDSAFYECLRTLKPDADLLINACSLLAAEDPANRIPMLVQYARSGDTASRCAAIASLARLNRSLLATQELLSLIDQECLCVKAVVKEIRGSAYLSEEGSSPEAHVAIPWYTRVLRHLRSHFQHDPTSPVSTIAALEASKQAVDVSVLSELVQSLNVLSLPGQSWRLTYKQQSTRVNKALIEGAINRSVKVYDLLCSAVEEVSYNTKSQIEELWSNLLCRSGAEPCIQQLKRVFVSNAKVSIKASVIKSFTHACGKLEEIRERKKQEQQGVKSSELLPHHSTNALPLSELTPRIDLLKKNLTPLVLYQDNREDPSLLYYALHASRYITGHANELSVMALRALEHHEEDWLCREALEVLRRVCAYSAEHWRVLEEVLAPNTKHSWHTVETALNAITACEDSPSIKRGCELAANLLQKTDSMAIKQCAAEALRILDPNLSFFYKNQAKE